MVDVVVGVLGFLAVCLVVVMAVRAYNRSLPQSRDPRRMSWELEERTENGPEGTLLVVYCVHPQAADLRVGVAHWGRPEFDAELAEARLEGEMKLDTLNRPRALPR